MVNPGRVYFCKYELFSDEAADSSEKTITWLLLHLIDSFGGYQ